MNICRPLLCLTQVSLPFVFATLLGCSSDVPSAFSPVSNSIPDTDQVSLFSEDSTSHSASLEIGLTECLPDFNSFWLSQVDGTEDRGFFYPEEAATYWTSLLPNLANRAGWYEIRGQYPEARFFSFQTYTAQGDSTGSLFDFDIDADPGSTNFFPEKNLVNEDSYTVKIVAGESPRLRRRQDPNTLYTGSQSTEPFYTLISRVYAPNPVDGQPVPPEFSDNPQQWEKQGLRFLPKFFYVVEDTNTVQPYFETLEDICTYFRENIDQEQGAGIGSRATSLGDKLIPLLQQIDIRTGQLASNPPQWYVGSTFVESLAPLFENYPELRNQLIAISAEQPGTELFSNDANAYLGSFINIEYGDVLVVRIKAPTFPNTREGEEIDPNSQETRFWSICMNEPFLLYVTGCFSDYQTEIDSDGYATFVFSREEIPPIDPVTGAEAKNWLRIPSPISLVLYRHTLPSLKRSHVFYSQLCSPFGSSCTQNYAAIERWMGPYLPESQYCSREEFEQDRCLSQ